MASMDPSTRHRPSDDELDEILNGTKDGEDIFDTSNIEAQVQWQPPKKKPIGEDALGLDEEIKVIKKRQPMPKLDEKLMLSGAGVPKLRRISKDRVKLKGKGHEYGDIARMLNMYQLWLDDVYPRAKFADGLAIIEKMGHSKRMQNARKAWIDEGRPKNKSDDEEVDADAIMQNEPMQESVEHMEGVEAGDTSQRQGGDSPHDERTLLADPGEDELDALLAEIAVSTNSRTSAPTPSRPAPTDEDMFADEMEAMVDMDDLWD